jgi:hypothetical protein
MDPTDQLTLAWIRQINLLWHWSDVSTYFGMDPTDQLNWLTLAWIRQISFLWQGSDRSTYFGMDPTDQLTLAWIRRINFRLFIFEVLAADVVLPAVAAQCFSAKWNKNMFSKSIFLNMFVVFSCGPLLFIASFLLFRLAGVPSLFT